MPTADDARAEPRGRTIGILQPGYLPWLGFFEQLARVDVFVLYDDVQYSRGSWRNRNRIKTPTGPQWLTVPVLLSGRGLPPIDEVEINGEVPWQKKHVHALAQNYRQAPFFSRYADQLFELLSRPWRLLHELDRALLDWLMAQLGLATPLLRSRELGIPGDSVGRLIDLVQALGGARFYEGAAGKNYICPADFSKAGLEVVFQDYRHPTYPQLHGPFVSHLSVVDLLFNCGPDSLALLLGRGNAQA